jgi:hypothetical protein
MSGKTEENIQELMCRAKKVESELQTLPVAQREILLQHLGELRRRIARQESGQPADHQ